MGQRIIEPMNCTPRTINTQSEKHHLNLNLIAIDSGIKDALRSDLAGSEETNGLSSEQICVLLICQIISSSNTMWRFKKETIQMPPSLPKRLTTRSTLFCTKNHFVLTMVLETIQSFNKFTFCTNVILSRRFMLILCILLLFSKAVE